MILLHSKNLEFYKNPFELPSFNLKNTDEKMISEKNACLQNGILVCFICNHCPYVIAIIKDLVENAKVLINELNIGVVGINSNDSTNPKYAEDSFEKMKEFSKLNQFTFPYLIDETQEIAKKFNAVCTPDLFLFLKDHESEKFILNYKGRLNNFSYIPGGPETSDDFGGKKHELLEYTKMILKKPTL
jgi:peroxiredoxin